MFVFLEHEQATDVKSNNAKYVQKLSLYKYSKQLIANKSTNPTLFFHITTITFEVLLEVRQELWYIFFVESFHLCSYPSQSTPRR